MSESNAVAGSMLSSHGAIQLGAMHKLVDAIHSVGIDRVNVDIVHRYMDEQQALINRLLSDIALAARTERALSLLEERRKTERPLRTAPSPNHILVKFGDLFTCNERKRWVYIGFRRTTTRSVSHMFIRLGNFNGNIGPYRYSATVGKTIAMKFAEIHPDNDTFSSDLYRHRR